jgi:hypothetical protein
VAEPIWPWLFAVLILLGPLAMLGLVCWWLYWSAGRG